MGHSEPPSTYRSEPVAPSTLAAVEGSDSVTVALQALRGPVDNSNFRDDFYVGFDPESRASEATCEAATLHVPRPMVGTSRAPTLNKIKSVPGIYSLQGR